MPTIRKKFMSLKKDRPRRDPKVLTEVRYNWLISEMPELIHQPNPFSSKEDEELCYRANKGLILERWLSDPQHYCRRPKCFLWFEDLQPKQSVGREKWWNPIDRHPAEWELSPVLELDHQWLHRLGLLQEREMTKFNELEREDAKQRAGLIELGLFLPKEINN